MTLHAQVHGLWTLVEGPAKELHGLQNRLDSLERQLSATEELGQFKLWDTSDGGRVWVLTGAWIAIVEEAQQVFSSRDLEDRLERVGSDLVEAKLLRGYQAAAVVGALSAPFGRGIIKVPTGGGKTRIAIGLVYTGLAVANISSWFYLVSNQQLAAQTQKSFDELGEKFMEATGSGMMGKVKCLSYGQVDMGEVGRFLGDSGPFGVIIDECHAVAAPTRAEALMRLCICGRVDVVIGMSATPMDRMDASNAVVLGLIGPVVYSIPMEELVAGGYLARGRVVVHQL